MRVTRRRKRKQDTLASPEWVNSIFDHLKKAFPGIASFKEKDLVKLARAVRHVERYSATDTQRGRPSRWPREELIKVGSSLSSILERETSGRISVATFVDHYIRILAFPSDVLDSLRRGDINLFEAEQLARITADRFDASQAEVKRRRAELLSVHLKSRSSGERLRRRVNEMLSAVKPEGASLGISKGALEEPIEIEDFDPYDSSHLFWEQIKQLGFAFRDIKREDVTDDDIEQLIEACEPVWNILLRIQRRKQQSSAKTLVF